MKEWEKERLHDAALPVSPFRSSLYHRPMILGFGDGGEFHNTT